MEGLLLGVARSNYYLSTLPTSAEGFFLLSTLRH